MKQKKCPFKDANTKIYEKILGGEWWAEYQFHPTRKWRFDYACPELKIAIEIDGGIFRGGRHSGGIGQLRDMEKTNNAAALGWLVFHYMPTERFSMDLREKVGSAIKIRQAEH